MKTRTDLVPGTAWWIIVNSDGDFFQCCDWLRDDDGVGLQFYQMTPSELLAAWIEIGCTFEYEGKK